MPRLDWLRRLQCITQAGLTYTRDPYDRERYAQLQVLAAELSAEGDKSAQASLLELLRGERGYATPKVDVRAVVEQNGKLLLVRESQDGLWSLPGGWVDLGESPSRAAEREVLEETGYEVKARKLLALYDKAKHEHPPGIWYVYKLFIACEIEGGSARGSIETLEVSFFGPDELPPLSLPRVTEAQLRRMFVHLADPGLPTDFD
jgi:ADP-ribose pyrophosphatase YjhB (NUDIX family)